jgi:hypothetical protein
MQLGARIPMCIYQADCVEKVLAAAVSVSAKKGFGQTGLLAGGKLFAVLRGEDLFLKLPAARVAGLAIVRKWREEHKR